MKVWSVRPKDKDACFIDALVAHDSGHDVGFDCVAHEWFYDGCLIAALFEAWKFL
jgi:hypothetical protein